jgi:hypothetical protein
MVLARGKTNIADQLFGWRPRGWGGEHFIKGNAVSYISSYRGVISIEILDH